MAMFKYLILLLGITAASAIRTQTREAIINLGYGSDVYTETAEACRLYGDTALHLHAMRNETHAVWSSTTPTTAVILRDAMLEAAANLGILARMTNCDMGVFVESSDV